MSSACTQHSYRLVAVGRKTNAYVGFFHGGAFTQHVSGQLAPRDLGHERWSKKTGVPRRPDEMRMIIRSLMKHDET